jgi:RIO kinase 2
MDSTVSRSGGEGESEDEEDEEAEGSGSESEVVDEDECEETDGVGVGAVLASGEGPRHEGEEEPNDSVKPERPQEQANAESLSQEPPRGGSRSSSPTSEIASQVEERLSVNASKDKEIRNKAAIDAFKGRAREKQKYHSRRGAERIGRPKGSKAKQDNRVQVDKSGLWT